MNYTRIDYSVELKEIGAYPQAYQIKEDRFDRVSPTSPWVIKRHEISIVEPKLNLVLDKRAKLTDILSTDILSFGFIVSKKLKDVLVDFNLPTHKFYACSVFFKGIEYEYYWFHFVTNEFMNWVNEEESNLKIRPLNIEHRDEVTGIINLKLSNEERLNQLRQIPLGNGVFWETLKFKKRFPKFDIFNTNELGNMTLISNDLLNALIDNKITGYRIKSWKHLSY